MADPDLEAVMEAIRNGSNPQKAKRYHSDMVQPLLTLAEFARSDGIHANRRPSHAFLSLSWQLRSLLIKCVHPLFLPEIVRMATDPKRSIWTEVPPDISSALLGRDERLTQFALISWWDRDRGTVMRPYDLASLQGIEEWVRAWTESGDAITKHVLFSLWDFQPTIPEAYLLERCREKGADSWCALISALWQRRRLSPEARMALVRDHLRLQLVELPAPYARNPAWRELEVVRVDSFPFPNAARVYAASTITCGQEPVLRDPDGGGNFCLAGRDRNFARIGGIVEGSALALVEVYDQEDRYPPFNEHWRLRWRLSQDEQKLALPEIVKPRREAEASP